MSGKFRAWTFTPAVHELAGGGIIQLNELSAKEVRMIVLKAPQDQVLAGLQAVAGIIARRHTLPIFVAHFGDRWKSLAAVFNEGPEKRTFLRLLPLRKASPRPANTQSIFARARALVGFFSSAKVNARNAP